MPKPRRKPAKTLAVGGQLVLDGELVMPGAPWDQMPGESDVAYAQFCYYRDMGRDRTVAKAAAHLQRSGGHLNNVAHDWRWVTRARAFDAELDRLFAARALDARMQMAERHAAIAGRVLEVVALRLSTLDTSKLAPADLARWLDVAAKMERLAWATPTTPIAADAADGGVDIAALDEQGRHDRLAMLKTELERRLADTRTGVR